MLRTLTWLELGSPETSGEHQAKGMCVELSDDDLAKWRKIGFERSIKVILEPESGTWRLFGFARS